ncbi:hypothetical protein CQ018_17760 [Arthrobacter sp. MYb227]|uniref:ferritin-like domain-containing protein n=1 Tax=Arthrobacter sp. MYb227 TaxID=1848601 RepID=UPI000CFE0401|nr:ferritin-like domain-containing protein [Arthrobacter sp. MYb227]PQZ87307.1 hypothetical protein CQ018_17760 [Arthrobacter sp. MYb227]
MNDPVAAAPSKTNHRPSSSDDTTFLPWVKHFETNPQRQLLHDESIDWDAASEMDRSTTAAFIHSLQRFELGESGDGKGLLSKAAKHGDPIYVAALQLLVVEEQKHSALFARGLERFGGQRIAAHWSDSVFVFLRRSLGLRTELGLFLVAESVSMGYFTALAQNAPDPVLRGIGERVATDEQDHIRFQTDRLRAGFSTTPKFARNVAHALLTLVAVGASTVVVIDHRAALRACGLRPATYWRHAMLSFQRAARAVFDHSTPAFLGPIPKAH